ncbi:hypothetical protein [Pseudomonas asplenii]|uniref:hypothetical protein n=1 Tax=Pseudomonas asplenii TaxID=53407 RepID=UPI0006B58697|nr:hypothetical protein [Pseudomonas fuscovaginae]
MTKKITPDPPPCRTSSLSEKGDYLRSVMREALDQINSEPAPPLLLDTLVTTASNPAATESARAPLFVVQPGITAKVALAHVSDLLKIAELNGNEIGPQLDGIERDLFVGLMHSLELSRAVVDSLLAEGNSRSSA